MYSILNKEFYRSNRQALMDLVKDNSIVLMFSGKAPHKSQDAYYPYEVNRNFYYLTGIERENIIYMAIKTDHEFEEFLFLEKNDPILEKWVGKKLPSEEAREISGVDSIFNDDYFRTKLNSIMANVRSNIQHVYFDFNRNAWDDPHTLSLDFYNELHSKYPYLLCKDLSKLLIQLRSIKKPQEIKTIKKAIDITNEGIKNLMMNAKDHIYEYELEAYFNFTIKSKGAGFAFDTIAASGKNATILHYIQNNNQINTNDLILFDLGASVFHYCADITRTFPVNGKFTERQKQIYDIVLSCMNKVIDHMQPGSSMGNINKLAKQLLAQGCKDIGLIDDLEDINRYYYHSIGHPLGLDTHDVGDRDVVLQPGMVYTCEPGLYIEEEGIGIRIEDDILITETGNFNLSGHIIKEVDDIENFMQSR
ncbi:MAG: aminopeptidase P N-terminal domain-containing protein [Eubacteriales bacterium]